MMKLTILSWGDAVTVIRKCEAGGSETQRSCEDGSRGSSNVLPRWQKRPLAEECRQLQKLEMSRTQAVS